MGAGGVLVQECDGVQPLLGLPSATRCGHMARQLPALGANPLQGGAHLGQGVNQGLLQLRHQHRDVRHHVLRVGVIGGAGS